MRATLDGIGLPVEPAAGWALTYGTQPYSRIFEVPTPVAVRLVKGARLRGSTLVLRAERRAPVTARGLTIYGPGPGTRPDTATVRVIDPRLFLRDVHVRLVANVRTRTGDRRRVGDGPLAVAQLSDDEAYRRWSVGANGKPFTAADIITQVLAQADPTARLVLGDSLDEGTLGALKEVPEDVLIDDRGDVAVARALGYAGGGLDLFVAEDGILTVGPRLDGSERPLFGVPRDARGTRTRKTGSPLGAWVVGAPGWTLLDRSRERPARYRVLFDRRLEIRLDFAGDDDEADFSLTTQFVGGADPPLTLTNVLPIPEHTLAAGGRADTQGTFVPIKTYLTAKAGTWVPAEVGNLDLAAIRRCWLSSGLQEYADPTYDEGGLAARAIGAIRQHYHAGFQLTRSLRERLVDLEASLTSIVDPKSGTRADSPVYADHAIWLSWRAAFQERARGLKGDALVRNFYANGTEATGAIAALPITSLRRAPARVAVVDQDLGVLRVSFSIDATGEQVTLVHSALDVGKAFPSTDPTQRDVLLQWGELAREHQLATVITAGLASPTTADGLHVVEVESPALMGELGASNVACTGPVRTLRVPGTVVAANFGWDDAQAGAIRSVIGGNAKPDTIASCLLNGVLLQIVAKAMAKADLASLLDRVDGSLTTALAPAGPAGGATIEHEVSRAGAKTTVSCAGDQPAPPFEAFLPESVRRSLLRRLP